MHGYDDHDDSNRNDKLDGVLYIVIKIKSIRKYMILDVINGILLIKMLVMSTCI